MSKEEEGRVGAMGIASSLPEISGLVMDLGGGSTQLSWLSRDGKGKVNMPAAGAVSMPYGAAAMSRRLAEAERDGTTEQLRAEIGKAIEEAYQDLKVPPELTEAAGQQGGFSLYLSGGGFRGWGYLLMTRHRVFPYPIPMVNGFKASREEFLGTEDVKTAAAAMLQNEDEEIFRVSDRRASQVPAVAFLVEALAGGLPQVKQVRFCQGGIREGCLFSRLSPEVQSEQPLVVATQPFSYCSSGPILQMLSNAFPSEALKTGPEDASWAFTPGLLEAFANLMYYHSTHSKDLQASAALRSTTSGVQASVHGILHKSRTLLALLLRARWGSEVPPVDESFKRSLELLVESTWTLWWIKYIGKVAALIAAVYPAGVSSRVQQRLELQASSSNVENGRTQVLLRLGLSMDDAQVLFAKEIKSIEKAGKRKNWVGGRDGVGMKVIVEINSLQQRC